MKISAFEDAYKRQRSDKDPNQSYMSSFNPMMQQNPYQYAPMPYMYPQMMPQQIGRNPA